ncbi:MAG: hypothetical protein IKE32_02710 [Aeriscardovia sp.]|nr:hypothetical protein [Aeriscardovia sp.]
MSGNARLGDGFEEKSTSGLISGTNPAPESGLSAVNNAAAAGVAGKRKRRAHRRVIRRGTELFDVEGDDTAIRERNRNEAADDNARILRELPPHWGVFDAEKER